MMIFDYSDANRRLEDLRAEAEHERLAAQVQQENNAHSGEGKSLLTKTVTLLAWMKR